MNKTKMKTALGFLIGLALYCLVGWVILDTTLGHWILGAGVAVYVIGGLIGGTLLLIAWLVRFFFDRRSTE